MSSEIHANHLVAAQRGVHDNLLDYAHLKPYRADNRLQARRLWLRANIRDSVMEEFCENWLNDVRASVEPTLAQRKQALASQRHLRELLSEGRFGRRILHDYMTGSFARHTAIRPVDDVDLVFIIDPDSWELPFFGDKPKPAKLLDSFLGVLRRRYHGSSLRRQRRSVGLTLSHVHVDVLPAVAGDGESIWIPDREAGQWLESSPKIHAEDATIMNKACGKRGKAMIKLLKYWNAQAPSTARLKSFIVETLAVRILGEEQTTSLVSGLLCFWDNIVQLEGEEAAFEWESEPRDVTKGFFGSLQLPDATGKNIAEDVSQEEFGKFAKQARIARERLAAALKARTTTTAHQYLAKLF